MILEDLMVGDYVTHKYYYDRPVKIKYFVGSKAKTENETFEISTLKAVPITEEFLIKNGFEYDYDVDECVADGGQFITLKGYVYEEDGVLIDYCNGDVKVVTDFNGEVTKRMSYIHELQHAMRLCNINKEIKL